jgi:hypothetical protein
VPDQLAGVLAPLSFCGIAGAVELSGCAVQCAFNSEPVLSRESDRNGLDWGLHGAILPGFGLRDTL